MSAFQNGSATETFGWGRLATFSIDFAGDLTKCFADLDRLGTIKMLTEAL